MLDSSFNTKFDYDRWIILCVFVSILSVLLFPLTHPSLWDFFTEIQIAFTTNFYFWPTVEWQVDHPLQPIGCVSGRPGCHEEKMLFRLFLPGLVAVLKSRLLVYSLQVACWPVFLYLAIREVHRLTSDRGIAQYAVFGFVGLYLGGSFVFDIVAWGDCFGYLFLMIALGTRTKWLLFMALSIGYWVDERVLISSALVGVYHVFVLNGGKQPWLKTNWPIGLAVLGSWVAYLSIRFGLGHYFEVSTPTTTANLELLMGVGVVGNLIKLFRGYELWWVIVSWGLASLYRQQRYILLLATVAGLGTTLLTSIMVGDTSRSMCYGFGIFFICIESIHRQSGAERLRTVLLWVALFCLLCPTRFMLEYGPPPIPFLQKL